MTTNDMKENVVSNEEKMGNGWGFRDHKTGILCERRQTKSGTRWEYSIADKNISEQEASNILSHELLDLWSIK